MKLNAKLIIAILLLINPLTFWGQRRNTYEAKAGNSPVVRTKYYSSNSKQDFDNPLGYLYLVAGVGTNILNGDNGNKYQPGFTGNAAIGWQIHEWVGIEGKLGYSTFGGNFNNVKDHFSNAFETNINLMVNLTSIIFGVYNNLKFDVIPHVGWGQVQSRGRVVYEDGSLTSYGYENYQEHNNTLVDGLVFGRFEPNGGGIGGRVVARAMSAGILFNYIINDELKVGLDIISTRADTDRFDAIPAGYHYDWYTTFNIRAQYKLKVIKKDNTDPCDNAFGEYGRGRR